MSTISESQADILTDVQPPAPTPAPAPALAPAGVEILETSGKAFGLMRSAHISGDIHSITRAYDQLDMLGKSNQSFPHGRCSLNLPNCNIPFSAPAFPDDEVHLKKCMRPDMTFFMLHRQPRSHGPLLLAAANGQSTNLDFTWAFGPVEIEASIDRAHFIVSAKVLVTVPILGRRKVVDLQGSLLAGNVKGDINAVVATGYAELSLRGMELWVKLELHVPFVEDINKEFMIIKL
ncbi:hypothetical protein BN14_05176 [Rhizoctonia solani AG-1 IB]|uniref:Uncharacterized protein n=1 Tax=Thanatephorus cucumeris (strain AG1-IB / isolate 7/3/14) TaxID=1108050 RepID=M5C5J8_THACB|nr:hypothetical protein BN14_05176 [Rhizoctonia solani AG-1 IB]